MSGQCAAEANGLRCDRFADHHGPHVAFTYAGDTFAWNDPVHCKNCGEMIWQPPKDYLRRWRHVETDDSNCRLVATSAAVPS